jgi:hypothetical protein
VKNNTSNNIGRKKGMQELHTVLHLRSVLGNLNSTLWAGLIALEICALQLQLCNHV